MDQSDGQQTIASSHSIRLYVGINTISIFHYSMNQEYEEEENMYEIFFMMQIADAYV